MKRTLASVGALVLTGTLGVVLPTAVAPAAAGEFFPCGYSAVQNTPVPISDDMGTASSILDLSMIPSTGPIVDLDVVVNITHSYDADMEISLLYGGHEVPLATHRGSNGQNFTDTRFDDGATLHIGQGTAPFSGDFRPEQTLNVFDDLDPSGFWVLRIRDIVSGEGGTLTSWRLILHTQWCSDDDRDTVKDEYDFCPSVKGVQPHGCPVRSRTVTIVYRSTPKEFRGKLTCSATARCHAAQPVRIYKVQAGKDALVGRGLTNATGNYAIPKASVAGTYYALAPKVLEEGVAECKLAKSANLAV